MARAQAANRAVETTDNARPPLITRDQLAADYTHLDKSIGEVEKLCGDAPSVLEDDEDLALVTRLGVAINAELKRCETAQKEEVRPFLDGQATVNAYLKHELPGRLTPLKARLESSATAY